MAYTTINKSSEHFNTKLYTGNGGTQTISGIGFQPDFTWVKGRNHAYYHYLQDAVRGSTNVLYTNNNNAQATGVTAGISAWNSDGYITGSQGALNYNGRTFVAWNWKANGSSTVTNNDGANTSYISHNSTAQFSIIKYTGTGSATNIGHGLNGKPDCFITKALSASDWHMWNNSFSANERIKINSTGAKSTNTSIFPTLPDATKIYFGSGGDVNQSGIEYICYAWKNVNGYSKFGSYTGNGNADGTFVYTGFKPNWVMIKETSGSGAWRIYDNKRPSYNEPYALMADTSDVEETATDRNKIDQLSNGFKLRFQYDDTNGSGGSYIYMAFGQSLVGSNNIPCTAR